MEKGVLGAGVFETDDIHSRTFPHTAKLPHFILVVAQQYHLQDDARAAAYVGLHQ